jgi:adenylyltransferase/sulfurtransferase
VFIIDEKPIEREAFARSLSNNKAGALTIFEGWVRDHNDGKSVQSLEYQVYPELALKVGEEILAETKLKYNIHDVKCTHRFGHLKLGDIAVCVGVTASHRDEAFKAARYVIDEIKHRLPMWKKEHYVDSPSEWVSCQGHHSQTETDYYKKQMDLVNQEALKRAKVLVVGAGGLGCPVLINLTSAGVGYICVADSDKIEFSNIHRQTLYTPHLVGKPKAPIAAQKLRALNPYVKIDALVTYVDESNVDSLVQNFDLIIDCTDNMQTKFTVHNSCFRHDKPLVTASIFKDEGQIRTLHSKSRWGCLYCSYESVPDDMILGNCNTFGALAGSLSVIGGIQSREAITFLQNGDNSTLKETFYFNVKSLEQTKIKNIKRIGCRCTTQMASEKVVEYLIDYETLTGEFEVVDLRNADENILDKYLDSKKKVAVLCHRGIRSRKIVEALRSQGHNHFYSVRGGACSL